MAKGEYLRPQSERKGGDFGDPLLQGRDFTSRPFPGQGKAVPDWSARDVKELVERTGCKENVSSLLAREKATSLAGKRRTRREGRGYPQEPSTRPPQHRKLQKLTGLGGGGHLKCH